MPSFERTDAIARLGDSQFDVLVVGGGITGAGIALDAASRGLRTALIERDDFASGTSSKSSKLIHGGLRYLQTGDIRLVYEALAERQRLLNNAPHLVHELAFMLPMFHRDGLVPKKVARTLGLAMWGYDLTGGLRIGKRHRKLSHDQTLEMMPQLKPERVAWSYLYYDARADDARLTLAVLRTAALDFGAVIANRVSFVGMANGPGGGAVEQVQARTAEGDDLTISARCVVNATGVWADQVSGLDTSGDRISLAPAKGVHVSFDTSLFENKSAAIVPVPGDRRSVFVIPWGRQTYVGTTDTAYSGDLKSPRTTGEDIEYLLRGLRKSTNAAVDESAIQGTWAGLRPLVSDAKTERTADLSRRHRVSVSPAGMITITGGKLTTYRDMAADAVDAAVEFLQPPPALRSCITAKLRLRGAEGHDAEFASATVGAEGLAHLRSRFGGETGTLLAMIDADVTLAGPLVPTLPYLAVEALYAARYEMATSLDDIVSRRTRARLRDARATAMAAPAVAAIVAGELGWTPAQVEAEVATVVRFCADDLSGATVSQ